MASPLVREAAICGSRGFLAVLALGLAMTVLPRLAGWQTMLVRSGSMRPDIPTGTGSVVRPVSRTEVRVGDVILVEWGTEDVPMTHVLHRVVLVRDAGAARQAFTRGDANDRVDSWAYVLPEQTRRVAYVVPYV